MKIEEHKRRAEVYRTASTEWRWDQRKEMEGGLEIGMCVAIAYAINKSRTGVWISWDWPETLVFRRELAREVGRLSRFSNRMNGTHTYNPNPDRVLIRGEILTRAAEYHEACVQAGRTL